MGSGRRGEFVEIAPALGRGVPVLKIDGPYGAPAEDVFGSEVAVLIGAGIGVTVSHSFVWLSAIIYPKNNKGRGTTLDTVADFLAIREYSQTHLVRPTSREARPTETSGIYLVGQGYRYVLSSCYLIHPIQCDVETDKKAPSVGSRVYWKRLKPPRLIVSLMPFYPSVVEPSPDTIAKFLRISIYLTQKMDQDTVQNIAINDIGQEFE
jgi:hypothetical protein